MIHLRKLIWTAAKLLGITLIVVYLLIYINLLVFLYNFSMVPD